MEAAALLLYQVEDLEKQLERSIWSILEPNPSICTKIDFQKIDYALIPALAFDQKLHRLGYGRGFYDRLLPKLTRAKRIGVGFLEQQLTELIPITFQDEELDELELF